MTDKNLIYVQKKDSDREVFSFDKLISSILKSGVPMTEAVELSKKVQSWVFETAKDGSINSLALRDKVIEVLAKDFPSESDSYQAFVKG